MMTCSFTDRSNARRAAKRLIAAGEAPASEFEIQPGTDGRFEICWKAASTETVEAEIAVATTAADQPAAPTASDADIAAATAHPDLAAVTAAIEAEKGKRAAKPTRTRKEKPAKQARARKAPELPPGAMPQKPVVTSAANQHYQKRFDRLAEFAAANDWNGVRGYEVTGSNTYSKQLRRYREQLLAAHDAQAE
jgi:hypothetical protein